MRILSPNIEHSINNTGFHQCLREFTTKSSDCGRYVHGEFEVFESFDVLNNFIDAFEVKFVDENYLHLRLGQGLPYWIKLIFTPVMGNEENVRISSEPTDLFPKIIYQTSTLNYQNHLILPGRKIREFHLQGYHFKINGNFYMG